MTGPNGRAPRRICAPGHLALRVPDLGRAVDFYTRAVGLTLVEQAEDAAYLRCRWEHHTLELHRGEPAAVLHLAWETGDDGATEELRALATGLGLPVREAPPEPGRKGLAFQFQDPGGLWNEVYRASERLPALVAEGELPPMRLAHFTRMSGDVAKETACFQALGFRLSDHLPGTQAFLRCNDEHHNLGLLGFERSQLHHHAFDVGSWLGIKLVCDHLTRQGVPVEIGPARHAPGNNIALYIRDPNALRVEFFCEMEQIPDDEDHAERRQPLVFDLWQRKPPPSGFRD